MKTNKKVMTGALLLLMMMAANFQNALNDYGIRNNSFMNGVIASGSNGSGTQIACNENGGNPFYFCTRGVDPKSCLLYKDLNAGVGAVWSGVKVEGTLNVDYLKKEGAKNLCDIPGEGCSIFTCMEINPQPN